MFDSMFKTMFLRLGVAATASLAMITIVLFLAWLFAGRTPMTVIRAETQVFKYAVDNPALSALTVSGLTLRSDDDLDRSCLVGEFEPEQGALMRFALEDDKLRITVSPPEGSDDVAGRMQRSGEGLQPAALAQNSVLRGEVEFVEALGCGNGGSDAERIQRIVVWGAGVVGEPVGRERGDATRPILLSGSLEIFGRSVGIVSGGGALYSIVDKPLPLPPGVVVTPRDSAGGGDETDIPMNGFAERNGDRFNYSAVTFSEEIGVAGPAQQKSFVGLSVWDRLFKDPSMQNIQLLLLALAALMPVFLEAYQRARGDASSEE